MTSEADFLQALSDIHKLSPLLSLEDQPLLQRWVNRLSQCQGPQGPEQERALQYARYLAYQLQHAQLRFPFSEAPPGGDGALPDLKQVLYGAESSDHQHQSSARQTSILQRSITPSARSKRDRVGGSPGPGPDLGLGAAAAALECTMASLDISSWDSHAGHANALQGAEHDEPEWDSHSADPLQTRVILTQLEDLSQDAPLWLLLSRVCPHTRDGGALLHTVMAEELAEWSARLAADQTLADRGRRPRGRAHAREQEDDQDQDQDLDQEEEWAPRADRRADYWAEVTVAWKELHAEDSVAGGELAGQMTQWLKQQNRHLQAEQAQLQALLDELRELKRHVQQSQQWREAQFDAQNRALQAEVKALQDSMKENMQRIATLKQGGQEVNLSRGNTSAARRLSFSQDSLNTSSQ